MHKIQNNLKINYEDDALLIIEKPIGILSHPDAKLKENDILSTLKTFRKDASLYAVINRLDFNTSGLVIIGKNNQSIIELNRLSSVKKIQKTYLCVVSGYFFVPEATLEGYLLKDSTQSIVRISSSKIANSQLISTRYKVIKEKSNMSILEVELLTGKTHQIRAHLAAVNHPIIGDPLYGIPSLNKKIGIKTQALCAYQLLFHDIETHSPLFYLNNRIFQTNDIPFLYLFQ
jgi:23S rRNA pseudouridine955/2504/2580 synthase